VILGLIIGFLFLEETHEDKKDRRDVGLEIGKWILRNLSWQKQGPSKAGYFESTMSYITEDEKADFDACSTSPLLATASCPTAHSQILESPPVKISLRQGFTRQVSLIIISYGILAL
jgi:hypothetical protein